MSLTVVSYTPNISSIPLKQYSNVRFTNFEGGMPLKSGFADNTSEFSQGRILSAVFTSAISHRFALGRLCGACKPSTNALFTRGAR